MGMPVPPNAGPDGTGPLSDPSLDDACLAGTSSAPGAPGNANTALMLGHSPCITSTAPTSPSLAGLEPSLQGVKVPDEDLTPQQRQHREEQLATLRKMQQMLFPEENPGAMNIGGSISNTLSFKIKIVLSSNFDVTRKKDFCINDSLERELFL